MYISIGLEGLTGKFSQIFKEGIIPILHNLIQKLEEEEIILNSFFEAGIVLMPKPDKDIRSKENYNLIDLVNIGVIFLICQIQSNDI